MTMNESWGYNPKDTDYKTGRDLVHTLCEIAGRGGNLLLNVSPTGTGALPPEQVERLETIAGWMEANAEAIHDTEPGLEAWQFYGPSTRKGNRIFLHLLFRPYETVTARGLPVKRVRGVRELRTGTALEYSSRRAIFDELLDRDADGELKIAIPGSLVDPLATVIELELEDS